MPAPVRSKTLMQTTPTLTPTLVVPAFTPTPNNQIDFTKLISDLEASAPKPYSEGFKVPDYTAKLAFRSIALSMIYDDPKPAYRSAAEYGYEFTSLYDLGDFGAESYVLREQHPIERGWGSYFFRKSDAHNIVVESPHPLADLNTPFVALDLYRALQAKALLVAGAHRDTNADGSSDPTHATETIFQTMHDTLLIPAGQPMEQTIFLQIHGYSAQEHPDFPQVVIGYNWKNDQGKEAILQSIIAALQKHNITTGVCTGKNYQGLCGTSNVQRQIMDEGIFIHLELGLPLRLNDGNFVKAMQRALNP
jgi:hypothetical protein